MPSSSPALLPWISVAVVLVILVISIVSVYVYDKNRSTATTTLVVLPPPAVAVERSAVRVSTAREAVVAVAASPPPPPYIDVPIIPLFWDDEEGAYMVRLRMGQGDVEAVVDTGSSNITAKGSDCTWTNCGDGDGDVCVTQSCPCGVDRRDGTPRENCADFYYRPRGPYVKPGQEGAGSKTTLVYGSQKDSVKHYMEEVSLPCVPSRDVSCATLLQGDDRVAPATDANEYLLGKMIVHLVHHITGTSSSNLFGLARPEALSKSRRRRRDGGGARHENGAYVVVQKLFRDGDGDASSSLSLSKKQRALRGGDGDGGGVWSLLLHKKTGWLALGSLEPCVRHTAYVPMVDPAAFSFFVTHFYVVEVVSLEVGRSVDALQAVKRPPKYCLLDTGTTYTYASPALGAQMQQDFGYTELGWCMRLTLGGGGGARAVLNYSAADLVDEEFPDSSVFQCLPGKTLADFDAIFTSRDVLLFGALMMRHAYWEFDMKQKRVGCWQLS